MMPSPDAAAPETARSAIPPLRLADAITLLQDRLAGEDHAGLAELVADICDARLVAQLEPHVLRQASPNGRATADRFSVLLARAIHLLSGTSLPDGLALQAGKTGLMLGGGGKLGNYHLGVLRTLIRFRLLPNALAGSSAGALIAAVAGTRRDDELSRFVADEVAELSADGHSGMRELYFNPLSQDRMKDLIARLIPDWTFAEAFAVSGRSINIVVSDSASDGDGRILNASVTPNVLLRDAVLASCAVPFIYASVSLRQRDGSGTVQPWEPGRKWMDGSIHADLPAEWMREEQGVSRLIASVVNPLELPLLTDPDSHGTLVDGTARVMMDAWRGIGAIGLGLTASLMQGLPPVRRMLSLSKRVVEQRVDADVIIAPSQRIHALPQMVDQATEMELELYIAEGARSAEGRIDLIAPAMRIEQAVADHARGAGHC